MYCKKCGKFIDYDADMCVECQQATAQSAPEQNTEVVYAQPVQPIVESKPVEEGSMTTGLGKSIASAILGFIGYIFAFVAIMMLSEAVEYSYDTSGIIGGAVALFIIALGLSIPGLILGIGGMRTFFNEKNAGRKKPIPTLIVGIAGMSLSALALFFNLLLLMLFAVI